MKNVFISHIHEDDDGLGKVKDLLGSKGYPIRDGSINSDKPNEAKSVDYIKAEIIRPRIKWAGCLMVYITPGTKASEWVNWEIEEAIRTETPVIGVWAHGDADCEVPDALKDHADAVVVGWQGDRIIDAIEGRTNDWQKSDGSPRAVQSGPRVVCQ